MQHGVAFCNKTPALQAIFSIENTLKNCRFETPLQYYFYATRHAKAGVQANYNFIHIQASQREVDRDFQSVYSRLVLCKTFRLVYTMNQLFSGWVGRGKGRGKKILYRWTNNYSNSFFSPVCYSVSRENSENRDFKTKINLCRTFARANSVCFSPRIFVDWTKMEKCSRLRKFFTGYGVNQGKHILIALRILTNDKCSKTFWKISPSRNLQQVRSNVRGQGSVRSEVYLTLSASLDPYCAITTKFYIRKISLLGNSVLIDNLVTSHVLFPPV